MQPAGNRHAAHARPGLPFMQKSLEEILILHPYAQVVLGAGA